MLAGQRWDRQIYAPNGLLREHAIQKFASYFSLRIFPAVAELFQAELAGDLKDWQEALKEQYNELFAIHNKQDDAWRLNRFPQKRDNLV